MIKKIDFEKLDVEFATNLINANPKLNDAIVKYLNDYEESSFIEYLENMNRSYGFLAIKKLRINSNLRSYIVAHQSNYYKEFLDLCNSLNYFWFKETTEFTDTYSKAYNLSNKMSTTKSTDNEQFAQLKTYIEILENLIIKIFMSKYVKDDYPIEEKVDELVEGYGIFLANANISYYDTETMKLYKQVSYIKPY